MTDYTQSLLGIILLFGIVHLGGWLSLKLGNTRLLGQLIVALLFGPTVLQITGFNWFNVSQSNQFFLSLTFFNLHLLALYIGLQIKLEKPQREKPSGIILGLLSTLMPFALCSIVLWLYKFSFSQALMLGTIAASVGLSSQLLQPYQHKLSDAQSTIIRQSQQFGILIVICLLALSVFAYNKLYQSPLAIIQSLLFVLSMILLSWFNLPKLFNRIENKPNSIAGFVIIIVLSLIFGWLSEAIGLVGPLFGVFLVAIMAARSKHQSQLQQQINFLAECFLIPFLCLQIGLNINLREAFRDEFLGITFMLIVLAITARMIVGYVVPRAYAYSKYESFQVASAIVPRGEFALIIAILASGQNQLSQGFVAASILLVLISLLASAPLLRRAFREPPVMQWQSIDSTPRPPLGQHTIAASSYQPVTSAEPEAKPTPEATPSLTEHHYWQRPNKPSQIDKPPSETVILPFPSRESLHPQVEADPEPSVPTASYLGQPPQQPQVEADPEPSVSTGSYLGQSQQHQIEVNPEPSVSTGSYLGQPPHDLAPSTPLEPITAPLGDPPEHNPLLPNQNTFGEPAAVHAGNAPQHDPLLPKQTAPLEPITAPLGDPPEHDPLLPKAAENQLYSLPASDLDTKPKKPSKLKTLASGASDLAKRLWPKRK